METEAPPGTLAPVARKIGLLGVLIVVVSTARATLSSGLDLGMLVAGVLFAAWALTPLAALWALSYRIRDAWRQAVAALLLVGFDAWARVEVFLFPTSSTDALLLLVTPALALIILLPIGLMVGALCGRAWHQVRGPRL